MKHTITKFSVEQILDELRRRYFNFYLTILYQPGLVLINLTHASILLILVMKISLSQELIQSLVAVNQKSEI